MLQQNRGIYLFRFGKIRWSKENLAVSTIYIICLLTVGLVGGYTISTQNRMTARVLQASQARADAAGKAQVAILEMGKAQAQLISSSDPQSRRDASLLAIRALSQLDESIQNLGKCFRCASHLFSIFVRSRIYPHARPKAGCSAQTGA